MTNPVRSLSIRKGDEVQIIAGKDRGLKGKVLAVLADSDRVIVEGVNRVKKHTRVGQNQRGAKTGGIVNQEAPIHVSNVMLIDPEDGRPTRVGFRREESQKLRADGTSYVATKSVRYSKRTGKEL
jgi:large subunit ribosomal protein L24